MQLDFLKTEYLRKVWCFEVFNKTVSAFITNALTPKAEKDSGQIIFIIAYFPKYMATACKE